MFNRKLIAKIKQFLNTRDIIVLHGARQVGKTSLLYLIQSELPQKDCIYFDLEDSRYLDLCNRGIEAVCNYLKQHGNLIDQERFTVFIDEIQYLANPSQFLKLTYDHYPYIKLIISGSSSFDIKKKFKDTLVGRTVNFEVFPLDFEEFLVFKQKQIELQEEIKDPLLIEELHTLYAEYMLFGGYPKIVLAETIDQKETYLQQIIDTYIKKDIRNIGEVRSIEKFNKLVQVLASQSGQLLNVSELSNSAKLAKDTLEDYLFLLENTYIIKLLTPFFKNIRSELFKTPKIFFYDTGILSMLLHKQLLKQVTGQILETALFSDLVKKYGRSALHYWRTQDKKEIDFVVPFQNKVLAIEVKNQPAQFSPTALKYFMSHYSDAYPVCIHLENNTKSPSADIIFLKPWELRCLDQIIEHKTM